VSLIEKTDIIVKIFCNLGKHHNVMVILKVENSFRVLGKLCDLGIRSLITKADLQSFVSYKR